MPQIITLILLFLSMLISANQHGKPKTGNHNFLISFISISMWLILLLIGGFFDKTFAH